MTREAEDEFPDFDDFGIYDVGLDVDAGISTVR
jgi:hypothetical protein